MWNVSYFQSFQQVDCRLSSSSRLCVIGKCQCLVACYVNCHWGKVGAVTLLAPGRRWSLTYGSASPLESMAFSPCGHKQTHTDTHTHAVVSKVTSSCPQTLHTTDRVRKRQRIWQTSSTVVTSPWRFWVFLSMPLFPTILDSFVLSSREPFSEIYIINIMWQYTICNKRRVSLCDGQTKCVCYSDRVTLSNISQRHEMI